MSDGRSRGFDEMPETRSLVKKLCKVMSEIKHVPKRGRNEFHRYDYVLEADLADAVREKLAAVNVFLFSSVDELSTAERTTARGGTTTITTVKMTFTFVDGDTGENMAFTYYGQGEDQMDKGAYKAFTGCTKYALMKSFLVPTGDDPENDEQTLSVKHGSQNKNTTNNAKPEQSSEVDSKKPATQATQATQADKAKTALLKTVNSVATTKGLVDRNEVHRLASAVCQREITSLNSCTTEELKRFLAFLNGKEVAASA